jgi:hypothetical protein
MGIPSESGAWLGQRTGSAAEPVLQTPDLTAAMAVTYHGDTGCVVGYVFSLM